MQRLHANNGQWGLQLCLAVCIVGSKGGKGTERTPHALEARAIVGSRVRAQTQLSLTCDSCKGNFILYCIALKV